MPIRPDVDWRVIRAEYEAGVKSISDLAEAYGVKRQSIHRRMTNEGWTNEIKTSIALAQKKTKDSKNTSAKLKVTPEGDTIVESDKVTVTIVEAENYAVTYATRAEEVVEVEERHKQEWREFKPMEADFDVLFQAKDYKGAFEVSKALKGKAEILTARQNGERKAHRIDMIQEGIMDVKRRAEERAEVFASIIEGLDSLSALADQAREAQEAKLKTIEGSIDAPKPTPAERDHNIRAEFVDALKNMPETTTGPEEDRHER
jgi:hypothetical protein